jgi:hypothetical protein
MRYGDNCKEVKPMGHRLMTDKEMADIYDRVFELENEGRKAEAVALRRTIPVPAYLLKVFKEKVGADFLIEGGWNLAEAEAQFGADWLTR